VTDQHHLHDGDYCHHYGQGWYEQVEPARNRGVLLSASAEPPQRYGQDQQRDGCEQNGITELGVLLEELALADSFFELLTG
jgi:hypothetical protein